MSTRGWGEFAGSIVIAAGTFFGTEYYQAEELRGLAQRRGVEESRIAGALTTIEIYELVVAHVANEICDKRVADLKKSCSGRVADLRKIIDQKDNEISQKDNEIKAKNKKIVALQKKLADLKNEEIKNLKKQLDQANKERVIDTFWADYTRLVHRGLSERVMNNTLELRAHARAIVARAFAGRMAIEIIQSALNGDVDALDLQLRSDKPNHDRIRELLRTLAKKIDGYGALIQQAKDSLRGTIRAG